ncbi:MAG: hypothetical protein ABH873_09375 [Candidatus Firestonebacteria bacterium]
MKAICFVVIFSMILLGNVSGVFATTAECKYAQYKCAQAFQEWLDAKCLIFPDNYLCRVLTKAWEKA